MRIIILGLLAFSFRSFAELPDIPASSDEKMRIELFYAKGSVSVLRGKKKMKARKKMGLLTKDIISTGKDSLAIIHIESSNAVQTLKLDKNSRLRLSKLSDNLQVSRLKAGGVFVYLKSKINNKKKNPKVILKANTIAMGVRGTEFFASYGPKGHKKDFWMCVNEGKVHVQTKTSKKGVLVKEGEGIQISAGEKLEKPRAYEWTKKLNWNSNPKKGKVSNKVNLGDHYNDLLDQDYD